MKKTDNPLFRVEQNTPNVHTVVFDNVKAGWEQEILLRGDAHHDNINCDWDFERQHLEEAVRRKAGIIDVGDLFCAMQGKYDPRSSMEALRPEHKTDKYLDALVNTATDFYSPYARNFIVIGRGNHETNITKRHGTDLTDSLTRNLRKEPGAIAFAGGYGGWVRFQFIIQKTVRRIVRLKYFHGAGGGALMSFGTLETRRQASYIPDADIIVNGHSHDNYILPIQRERLSGGGRVVQDCLWCIRTPTYKDEYRDGSGGFHVEGGRPPKPIGAVWIKFVAECNRGSDGLSHARIRIEPTPSLRNG